MKRTLACLVAAASFGCNTRALRGMGYTVGADYWLAELDASMDPAGGPSVSSDDLGMDTETDIYSFTVSVMKKRRTRGQSERWTVGFWQAEYAGAMVPGADLDFGSVTFSAGDKVSTDATFTAYRIVYEEETAGGTGRSGRSSTSESHRGWLGLAFFTFDVTSKQGGPTPASYSFDKKNIPAIIIGYSMETRRNNMLYFASAEGMDLGWFKMGGVTGLHFDWSAGIKYAFSQSGKMFLTAAYRHFEGDYSYSGNGAHFIFEGVTLGAEMTF